MRLHVRQGNALGPGDRRERTDLVEHEILDLARRGVEIAPAEPDEIGEAGMRADGNPGVARQPNRRPHHRRIPGMKATGHVCRRHAAHDLGVVAEAVRTEGFADVAIEIDGGSHTVTSWAKLLN